METPARRFLRFGPFEVDSAERRLTRDGTPIPLTPKAFDTLLVLIQSAGRTVEKDTLLKEVWPDTFVEDGNLAVNIFALRKALGHADSGEEYIETIPKRGYRFTVDVRQCKPESENANLDLGLASETARSVGKARYVRLAYGGAVMLGGVLFLTFLVSRVPAVRARLGFPTADVSAYRAPRPSIAVLGFQNLTGRADQRWLSTAFSEMLATELGATEKLRVIPGENIARMRRDLSLADADSYTPDSLRRIRGNLGTDMVVLGSYTALGEKSGGQIRLDLRLQDTSTGQTAAVLSVTGTEAKLFELVSQAGEQLRRKAGIESVPSADTAILQASHPETLEAERLYAEGLAYLHNYNDLSARAFLERASQTDPKFAMAHSALALVWTHLGYSLKAREEAKLAFDLSAPLSREQRQLIEARYRATNREWSKAAAAYRALSTLFPDNLDYELELANALVFAHKTKDAIAILQSLKRSSLSGAYVPRVDLQLAFAESAVSDLPAAIAAAQNSEAGSRAIGAKELEARAWHLEANALINSGHADRGAEAYQHAKYLYAAIANTDGVARVQCDEAWLIEDQGDPEGARKMFQDSLKVFQETGNLNALSGALAGIAETFKTQDRLAEARKMYEESLAVNEKVGAHASMARFNLAIILYDEGNLAKARSEFAAVLAASSSAGDKFGVTASQIRLADISFDEGDVAAADKLLRQALAMTREIQSDRDIANALVDVAIFSLAQDKLDDAEKSLQLAQQHYQRYGDKAGEAHAQTVLAELLIEEGHAAQSEPHARESAQAFHKQKISIQEAVAESVLASALLAENRTSEAQKTIEAAQSVAQRSEFRADRLAIATISARVAALNGKSVAALRNLEAIIAESKRLGLVPQQLEASLALGEIEMKHDKSVAARQHLADLASEAKAKGFLLIARKAAELTARRAHS